MLLLDNMSTPADNILFFIVDHVKASRLGYVSSLVVVVVGGGIEWMARNRVGTEVRAIQAIL
jgi:hypothetical protein